MIFVLVLLMVALKARSVPLTLFSRKTTIELIFSFIRSESSSFLIGSSNVRIKFRLIDTSVDRSRGENERVGGFLSAALNVALVLVTCGFSFFPKVSAMSVLTST